MLVGLRRVVLDRDVVAEEDVRERFEAVRVVPGDVDGDGILLADVLRERVAARAVEHHDPGGPAEAREEVVLPALVVVEAAEHARARERDVRLPHRLRQRAVPSELAEPATLVLDAAERDPDEAVDHAASCLFAPVCSMRWPMSARCCQCFPASSHQPVTSAASSRPASA